ncbi:MAG: hypothetical protein ACYDBV_12775 [Nitrospiria bacterium]
MDEKIYLKCTCGEYHPEDECEIVLIKIVKGKKCQLNAKLLDTTTTEKAATVASKIPTSVFKSPQSTQPVVVEAADTSKTLSPEELLKYRKEKRFPREFMKIADSANPAENPRMPRG